MVEAWAVFARDRGLSVGLLRWFAAKLRATLLRFLLYRVVLPRADHVFVQSEVMRDSVASQGVSPARMTAVPMGVDTETMPVLDAPVLIPSAVPVFAYLGTLNRPRHPELMIEAFALLRARGVHARLLLIGDAEEPADRSWLRALIAKRGLQADVELTGWLQPAEGWRRCMTADACLSPVPRGELLDAGSPTKLVEYLHMGLPVIANDQPEQAALLAQAGGSCAVMTAEGFADAMQDMLLRYPHHQAVARAGQKIVRRTRSYHALAQAVAHQLTRLA